MPLWKNVPPNTKVGQKIDDWWVVELKKAPSFAKMLRRASAIKHNEFWESRDSSRIVDVPNVGPNLLWALLKGPQISFLP